MVEVEVEVKVKAFSLKVVL